MATGEETEGGSDGTAEMATEAGAAELVAMRLSKLIACV